MGVGGGKCLAEAAAGSIGVTSGAHVLQQITATAHRHCKEHLKAAAVLVISIGEVVVHVASSMGR